MIWDSNVWFLLTLSPTSFSIYWWFLPETLLTIVLTLIPSVLTSLDFPVWESFPFSGGAFCEWPPPGLPVVVPGAWMLSACPLAFLYTQWQNIPPLALLFVKPFRYEDLLHPAHSLPPSCCFSESSVRLHDCPLSPKSSELQGHLWLS